MEVLKSCQTQKKKQNDNHVSPYINHINITEQIDGFHGRIRVWIHNSH